MGEIKKFTDQEIVALYKQLKSHPNFYLTVALCIAGEEMIKAHSGCLKMETNCSLDGESYEVTAEFRIHKINQ